MSLGYAPSDTIKSSFRLLGSPGKPWDRCEIAPLVRNLTSFQIESPVSP
jgi:hypothetical protein